MTALQVGPWDLWIKVPDSLLSCFTTLMIKFEGKQWRIYLSSTGFMSQSKHNFCPFLSISIRFLSTSSPSTAPFFNVFKGEVRVVLPAGDRFILNHLTCSSYVKVAKKIDESALLKDWVLLGKWLRTLGITCIYIYISCLYILTMCINQGLGAMIIHESIQTGYSTPPFTPEQLECMHVWNLKYWWVKYR